MQTLTRKSQFNAEIAETICERLADGETLTAICEDIGISAPLVSYWQSKIPEFAEAYTRARAMQLERFADDVITLSDEAQGLDSAGVQAVKLRTDNRKWLLSKLRADVYGDKLDVTSAGKALAPPTHQIDARVQSIVMQAAERMRLAQGLGEEAKGLLE